MQDETQNKCLSKGLRAKVMKANLANRYNYCDNGKSKQLLSLFKGITKKDEFKRVESKKQMSLVKIYKALVLFKMVKVLKKKGLVH